MPDPDPQPPTPPGPARGTSAAAAPRGACVWFVLILLAAAVVVQAVAANHPNGWDALARRAPRAAANALVYALAAILVATVLHVVLRRAAVWVMAAAVAAAMYPAWTRWPDGGRAAAAYAWTWVPFIVLLALAAMHAVPRALREAAAIDRATRWFAFRTITLPLAAPLLLVGVLFAASVAAHPLDARQFLAAHALLIGGIAADALLTRSGR